MIQFDAETEPLPFSPPGARAVRYSFSTCPGSVVSLELRWTNPEEKYDNYGLAKISWWEIVGDSKKAPKRYLKMHNGSQSMTQLLKRYGIQDGYHPCVNHKHCSVEFSPIFRNSFPMEVPSMIEPAIGVPQFQPRSGICWFNSLCWVCVANKTMRDKLSKVVPLEIRKDFLNSIYNRGSALKFREWMWEKHDIGDDISKPPEEDGCNGMTELLALLSKLRFPVILYENDKGKLVNSHSVMHERLRECKLEKPTSETDDHILVIRFIDGNHEKFPMRRRIALEWMTKTGMKKIRYKLVGCFMGSAKCGHQTGLCHINDDKVWGMSDADMNKDGIGPLYFVFDPKVFCDETLWWKSWARTPLVTKYNHGEFCPINPHNPADNSLDTFKLKQRRFGRVGTVSCDWIYVRVE
jgi:hypothetical protein